MRLIHTRAILAPHQVGCQLVAGLNERRRRNLVEQTGNGFAILVMNQNLGRIPSAGTGVGRFCEAGVVQGRNGSIHQFDSFVRSPKPVVCDGIILLDESFLFRGQALDESLSMFLVDNPKLGENAFPQFVLVLAIFRLMIP